MKKRFLAAALALAMLLMMVPSAFAASDGFDDVPGHWAEDAINRWSGYGVVNGVGDNQFAPNGTLTRAQAAQVFANLLDLEVQADISRYTDVPEDSWYHTAIAQCVAAGILTGTGGSAMDPQSPVTREELFVMFARALNIRPQSSSDVTFGDSGEVSGWAQGYINALADRGFVSGVGGGMLAPGEAINRASVMSLLDKTISDYANTSGTTVGNASGVVLVVADNVSVAGDVDTLVVYGGSASVTGSQVAEAAVAGENASLSVSGSAVVERVDVAGAEAVLTLTGSVRAGQVTVSGESAQVSLSGQAQAASVAVEETAAGAGLTVGAGSAVTTVDSAAANVTISGSGTVETANVSGNNTTVNTDGTDLTVSQGTTGVTENNKPVSGGTTVETEPETQQPEQPVTPPVYIPDIYTVTFVDTANETIDSVTVVENTTGLTAPEVEVTEGQKVSWYNGTELVDLSTITVNSNLTLTAVVGLDDFTAGNGTEAYPYLISNADELKAVDGLSDKMSQGTPYSFELLADIDMDDVLTEDWGYAIQYFCGTFEGNNHTLYASNDKRGYLVYDTISDVTIQNLTLIQNSIFVGVVAGANYGAIEGTVHLKSITVQGTDGVVVQMGNNDGSFITWADSAENAPVILEDCVNRANINAYENYAGIFIGGYLNGNKQNGQTGDIRFIRCVNYGDMTGQNVGFFTGNNCDDPDINKITIKDCANYGTLIGTTTANFFAANGANKPGTTAANSSDKVQGINKDNGTIAVQNLTELGLTVNEDGYYVITAPSTPTGIAYYVVDVYAQNTFDTGSSYAWLSERVTASAATLVTTMTKVDKMIDSTTFETSNLSVILKDWSTVEEREDYVNARYQVVDVEGTKYMVVYSQDMIDTFPGGATTVSMNTDARYRVSAYTANGTVIGTANVTLS